MASMPRQVGETTDGGGRFDHRAHLRAAFTLLREHDFIEALTLFASRLKAVAQAAGVPEKYNATITTAFIALLAERMAESPTLSFDQLMAANPDLLDKTIVERYYAARQLETPQARRAFIMPPLHGARHRAA